MDARLLSKPMTGIGRYVLELCKALCDIPDLSLFLYSSAPIGVETLSRLKPATIRTCRFKNRIFHQIWSEFILPVWAKRDNLDVFWGPAHRLPHWLPATTVSVVTIHDLVWKYAGQTMRPLSRLLESYQMPKALKIADHIVVDSQATADGVLKEFDVPQNKISVVYLGSDHLHEKSNSQFPHTLKIKKPYGLFVGTLEPRKNLINLLTAFSNLPQKIRNMNMLIIVGGQGWGGIDLQNTIKNLDLTNDVQLLGYVNDETLASLYTHAKFLAMPSLYEGFGLPLVEAMFYGVPILTSNNSSMSEVAGNAAILVDPWDIKSIENGLLQLITDDTLQNQLTENAKFQVRQFNWETSAAQLYNIFKTVAS